MSQPPDFPLFDWQRFIEPRPAEEDTRPCARVDAPTEPLVPPDAARVEGRAAWTTVDAMLNGGPAPRDDGEFTGFATVGRDGVIAIRADWPVGTEVMVTVQRMGIGGL